MADEEKDNKLHITQWVQITTAVITMIASFGLWLVKTASTPSIEIQEIRTQIVQMTKDMVRLQLDNEGFKYQIQNLERRLDNGEVNPSHMAK